MKLAQFSIQAREPPSWLIWSDPNGASAPGILVCHENRGLLEHHKDVARRLGKAGYVALAVDILSRQGGTDQGSDPTQIPGLLANTPAQQLVQDFRDGLRYIQSQTYVRKDRIGMIGFCL